ncbi:unnamed protein product [Brugia timori]|uniref:Uncharacterized protein n=1 Tax=Brugia timori TaxID=42155 RepID=A0A0R3RDB8_9BILA|nr:unnamed protein product [Brugia timori]
MCKYDTNTFLFIILIVLYSQQSERKLSLLAFLPVLCNGFQINSNDGLLYHARSNWIFTSLNDSIFHPTDIFRKYITDLNNQYQKMIAQVLWQDWNLVPFWKILSKKIEKCTSKWRMYGCKAPYHLCWKALNDEDEWIFSHINVKSDYILL